MGASGKPRRVLVNPTSEEEREHLEEIAGGEVWVIRPGTESLGMKELPPDSSPMDAELAHNPLLRPSHATEHRALINRAKVLCEQQFANERLGLKIQTSAPPWPRGYFARQKHKRLLAELDRRSKPYYARAKAIKREVDRAYEAAEAAEERRLAEVRRLRLARKKAKAKQKAGRKKRLRRKP